MPPPPRLRSVPSDRTGRARRRPAGPPPAPAGPARRASGSAGRRPAAAVFDVERETTVRRDAPPGPHHLDPAAATRRAFTLILLTLFVPGSAQVVAGGERARRIGRAVLKFWLGVLGVIVLLALVWLVHKETVLGLFTHQWVLRPLALVLMVAGIAWPALLLDAWRRGQDGPLSVRTRRVAVALTTVLALLLCMLPIMAGRRVWAAADLLHGVFGSDAKSAAVAGRYNVLLLGGDAGPDRVGTRPDSINLASVDAATGRTVLLSFPRNLQNIPFPHGTRAEKAMPQGWNCGDDCLLNAIYTWGSANPKLFPGAQDPGAEAMKEAVQGITGLTVNYYVLIDLKGFQQLIDAVGGIDIKVEQKVPIGGGTAKIHGWIQPGEQHLDGYHALWYGRSREGASDYARMARQRCVMTAMLNQLDPVTLLNHFQDIAAAGAQVVSTDIPAGQLPSFVTLGTRAKSQKVESVQFVPPLIVPHHPDLSVIRAKVQQAISANEKASAPAVPAKPASSTPKPQASAAAGTAAGDGAVDVRQVCSAA